MKFEEAVRQRRKGKKIKSGDTELFLDINNNVKVRTDGMIIPIHYNTVTHDGWEIVEDKKDYNKFPVCPTCWKKGQIQEDCKECKGSGVIHQEDKNTLSDNIMCIEEVHKMYDDMSQKEAIDFDKYLLFDTDVALSIKEFIDVVEDTDFKQGTAWNVRMAHYKRRAKEIFGERLI